MEYNKTISSEVADALMDMAAFLYCGFYYQRYQTEPPIEEVNNYGRKAFIRFCNVNGIESVESNI